MTAWPWAVGRARGSLGKERQVEVSAHLANCSVWARRSGTLTTACSFRYSGRTLSWPTVDLSLIAGTFYGFLNTSKSYS